MVIILIDGMHKNLKFDSTFDPTLIFVLPVR